MCGFSGREAGGERARIARELGCQVLDEVDLVDVAARDRIADPLDRCGVIAGAQVCRQGPKERVAESSCIVARIVIIDNILPRPDGTGCERQRARLRRSARVPAPDRRGEAVPEVQVGDEILAARREEAALAQPPLEQLEGALGLVDLDRVAAVRHV